MDGLARRERGALGAVDRFGSNAPYWAAGAGHLAFVAWLDAFGLDPSEPAAPTVAGDAPTTRGRPPLHFAARNGRAAVVRYFCGPPGVDAGARAFRGASPLQLAVWRNHGAVARALADDFGADVGQRNDVGCGLAHWLAIAPPAAGPFPPPPPPVGLLRPPRAKGSLYMWLRL